MLDKGYFQLIEQVFTLARIQVATTQAADKAALTKILQLEEDLIKRLEEYNATKQESEKI